MRNDLLSTVKNSTYPFVKLVSEYEVSFDIMFAYQADIFNYFTIGGKKIELELTPTDSSISKLNIMIFKNENDFNLRFMYRSDLYKEETIRSFADTYINILKEFLVKEKLCDVQLINDEQEKLLDSFNDNKISYDTSKTVLDTFKESVEKYADKIAVVYKDKKYTYREVDEVSNKIAYYLANKGIGKGDVVSVLIPRCEYMVIASLGILKSGAAYQPLDPSYPSERLEFMIDDSCAKLLIADASLLELVPNYDGDKVLTKDIATLNYTECELPKVLPTDLFNLIYTSGSTGTPKGTMMEHQNIMVFSVAHIQLTELNENSVVGAYASYGFDACLMEMYPTLSVGATVHIIEEDIRLDLVALNKYFESNNITHAFMTTQVARQFATEIDNRSLKYLLTGGEKLVPLEPPKKYKMVNGYGPTECTVYTTSQVVDKLYYRIPVGNGMPNMKLYVVDKQKRRLPYGALGELCASGRQVYRGYLNRPEKTAEAYENNPYYNDEGYERFYHTGDIVRFMNDGRVDFIGRNDGQVKIRGLRIELGEIEKCLTNIDGIKSGIALIKKVGKADNICTYYTADKEMDEQFIKEELSKTLTDYLVPAYYVQLDEMPLTPNGKVNTKVLPEPADNKDHKGQEPKNETERKFCNIFAEILELDKVYVDDNFFDIGGISLTATRVIISASKDNIEIAYSDVFANPTPQKLAKLVTNENDDKSDELADINNFDYSEINKVLDNNNLDNFRNGEKQELGDVLLTGPAGFIGIHILYELLHKYNGKVYCLIRDKNNNPAEKRLNSIFFYYFEESIVEKFSDRVVILSGDVTDKDSFEKFKQYHIDTVINCAANVKHFPKGTDIEDVNLYGTLNVMEFCKEVNARLIHVSTMSVGGMFVGEPGDVTHLKENQLYFGQYEGSKYTMSNFLAERAILSEIANGFNGKIMRVGTFAARNSDGEYQINFTTNSFMGRLKSTMLIGKYPYDSIEMPFELSPIDFVAKDILLLGQTPKECTVFHPFNNHTLLMGDLYKEMDKIGLKCEPAENEVYQVALNDAEQDPDKAKILSSMIAYQNMAHGQKTFPVGKSNNYTMQVLYRLGFTWPVTSVDYMKKFIKALRGLGFFD